MGACKGGLEFNRRPRDIIRGQLPDIVSQQRVDPLTVTVTGVVHVGMMKGGIVCITWLRRNGWDEGH